MEDVKLVAESFDEFKTNEGVVDFLGSARTLIQRALKEPNDEKKVNNALTTSFAKQFANFPKLKEAVLKFDNDKKIAILKMAAKKLEDKKIGSLTLVKRGDKLGIAGSELEARI